MGSLGNCYSELVICIFERVSAVEVRAKDVTQYGAQQGVKFHRRVQSERRKLEPTARSECDGQAKPTLL
jgi:hypothetical protein